MDVFKLGNNLLVYFEWVLLATKYSGADRLGRMVLDLAPSLLTQL